MRDKPRVTAGEVATRNQIIATLSVFAVLAGCIALFPATGEGDATLHFLNARTGAAGQVPELLHSWARPLFKLLIIGPAWLGLPYARLTVAALSAVTAWHTIGLARDLQLPRPTLAAFFLIAQPVTFAVAQDTLTELPAALAVLAAMRLWLHGRTHLSCLVIAFTPLLRPEGFFFIAAWAVLALWQLRARPISTVVVHGALLGVGLLTWCATTWALVDDPLFLINQWRWPAQSYEIYGHGGPFDYLVRNVWFLGSALFPLFVVGCVTACDRKFALVWLVWGLVIGVHSILWWRGWFASAGLVRILAVSSPSAALLCLQGFNWSAERLDRWRVPPVARVGLGVAWLAWASASVVQRYLGDPEHLAVRVAWPATEFVRQQRLTPPGTHVFAADLLCVVPLEPRQSGIIVEKNHYDRERERALLAALPSGSIGFWSNSDTAHWLGVSIEDLPGLGYDELARFEERVEFDAPWRQYRPWRAPEQRTLRYVVVRKR